MKADDQKVSHEEQQCYGWGHQDAGKPGREFLFASLYSSALGVEWTPRFSKLTKM